MENIMWYRFPLTMLTKCFIYLHIFRSIKPRWRLYSVSNTYFEVDLNTTKKGTITSATAIQFFICVEDVRALCHDTVHMWYANLIFRVRRRRRRIRTQWGSESDDGFEEIRRHQLHWTERILHNLRYQSFSDQWESHCKALEAL